MSLVTSLYVPYRGRRYARITQRQSPGGAFDRRARTCATGTAKFRPASRRNSSSEAEWSGVKQSECLLRVSRRLPMRERETRVRPYFFPSRSCCVGHFAPLAGLIFAGRYYFLRSRACNSISARWGAIVASRFLCPTSLGVVGDRVWVLILAD